MYDWEEDAFDGGDPDGPVQAPISQVAPEHHVRVWLTKGSFVAAVGLAILEIILALTDASCGAQIAATGALGLFAGILIPIAAWWFTAPS